VTTLDTLMTSLHLSLEKRLLATMPGSLHDARADAAMARDGQGWHARRHQEVVRPSTREAQFIPGLPGTSHGDGDASSGGMFSNSI
jgi:hypothetical protein